jgi:hypothetical protein
MVGLTTDCATASAMAVVKVKVKVKVKVMAILFCSRGGSAARCECVINSLIPRV